MYAITTETGTVIEHQRHEAERRARYLVSVGVSFTVTRVDR